MPNAGQLGVLESLRWELFLSDRGFGAQLFHFPYLFVKLLGQPSYRFSGGP
jgi:hypothetical protein